MRIWHLFAGASLLGACALGTACSSSSSGGGTTDASTEGGGDDGGSDGGACPSDANVATFDSGTSSWACIQRTCGVDGGLIACGNDCTCNTAIYGALQCVVMKGGADASQADTTTCFSQAFGMAGGGSEVADLISCLTAAATPCAGITVEGGVEGGTEAGHGEGGGSEGGGSEGGGSEGGSDGGAG
jgi:hypothetical protein